MKHKRTYKSVVLALSAPLMLNGCASTDGMSNTALGCMGGALAGGVATFMGTGDVKKAAIGALAGGIVGCGVGAYIDAREKELEELAQKNSLKPEFERIAIDKEKGTSFSDDAEENVIASQVSLSTKKPMFASNRAEVTDPQQLKNLRGFLKGYIKSLDEASKIYVVGHTDSSGSASYNQKLSERRAKFIADELVKVGANPDRIFFEGVGESQPVASNQTEDGKRKNRRFELVDVMLDKRGDKGPERNMVPDEQVVQVASAKKTRIENVINDLPVVEKKDPSTQDKAPEPKVKASSKRRSESLGLNGVALSKFDQSYVVAALGERERESSIPFFPTAQADDSHFIGSCAYTAPVAESTLKSYTGRSIQKAKVSESITNLYGTAWYGMAAKTGITVGPIGIEKETLNPTHKPHISFYKNYDGSATQPDYKYPVSVETYRGDGTVLVRMFAKEDDALMRCTDVVFNTNGDRTTRASAVIYQENQDLMAKSFKMNLVEG
ncbi:OmpA family protein [Alteromonas halophila]|uniref:OmpA-like domain-containing protein n=1 Tax=Alteromonas halophila TaxID=516698 RepID=A0A918MXG6_9ALTE|nr:OmpA family protein [Alteromonas halophila]GGW79011.1 hypothetical protein GCM10007391_09600 [Alteromonas halophila]